MAKPLPSLPNELWLKILENLCDSKQRPDAWIRYRNVCKSFQESVELIFRERHLPKTWISFDRHRDYYYDNDEKIFVVTEGTFARLSDDKKLAIFKINGGERRSHDITIERLQNFLEGATFEKPCCYVQVRHDVNDTPIPGLTIDYEKLELTCDWRGLFTQFFGEEHFYNQRTLKWVKEKESWVNDLKTQMQKGELDMLKTLEKAMYAFADGSHESRKIARRARIRRQYREEGEAWDFERNGDKIEERSIMTDLNKARKMASLAQFSDDESGAEDDGEEDEDEDEDGDEDEDVDSSEVDEDEWEDDDDEFDGDVED